MRIIPNTVLLLLVLLGAIRKLRKHIFDPVSLLSKHVYWIGSILGLVYFLN